MDARVGIEPTIRDLQSPALPLGYPAIVTPPPKGWGVGVFPYLVTKDFNPDNLDSTRSLKACNLVLGSGGVR